MAQTPPIPFDVKAIAPYSARNANEVSLEVGKIYRVLATDGRGVWWQSKTDDGNVGWFPANYTQIVEAAAPPPTPEPPVTPHIPQLPQQQLQQSFSSTPAQTVASPLPQQQQPQTPVSPQSQQSNASIAASTNGNHSVPSDRGNPQKSNLDPALKGPPIKDPCVLTVHVVESVHNTLPTGKSANFFIYKRQIMDRDPKKLKPLFNIAQKTKAGPWKWNEEYKLYIKDAEMEVVGLRFCVKNDFKCKGKDLLGEIEFQLRSTVRNFDKPNGVFQWFPLKVGNDKVGESLLFIEYCDPRPFSGPSDVQHKGHVGITAGGFEIRDIPQEWKQLFRLLNIKKKDLENNAQMAAEVFDIMQKAVSEGVIPGNGELPSRPAGHSEEVNNNHHQHAAQVAPTPPPLPAHNSAANHNNNNHSYQVTPSVPQPPPVPVVHTPQPSHSAPAPPPPPVATGPKPPPPPAPISNSNKPAGGGGNMSLLEQIQRGTNLKPAQVKEVQAGTASTGNPLADTLLTAMSKYRVDIEGKDEDGDDWD